MSDDSGDEYSASHNINNGIVGVYQDLEDEIQEMWHEVIKPYIQGDEYFHSDVLSKLDPHNGYYKFRQFILKSSAAAHQIEKDMADFENSCSKRGRG